MKIGKEKEGSERTGMGKEVAIGGVGVFGNVSHYILEKKTQQMLVNINETKQEREREREREKERERERERESEREREL